MTPQWEHGYRCHGYWIGTVRWGWVGLSPGPRIGKGDTTYWYGFTPHGAFVVGRQCNNLREGKRIVEKLFRDYIAQEQPT